jgi:hypothetical protein
MWVGTAANLRSGSNSPVTGSGRLGFKETSSESQDTSFVATLGLIGANDSEVPLHRSQ